MINLSLFAFQIPKLSLQIFASIILCRFISPEYFGYFAISVAVLAFIEVIREYGLHYSVLSIGNLTYEQNSSLFWYRVKQASKMMVFSCIVITLLTLFGLPRVLFYNFLILLPLILINSLERFFFAWNIKEEKTKLIIFSEILGIIFGFSVSLLFCRFEKDFLALPLGLLITSLTSVISQWISNSWKPQLIQDFELTQKIESSRKFTGPISLLNYISKNVDTLILASSVHATQLGFYNRAFQLIEVPIQQLNMALNDQVIKNSYEKFSTEIEKQLFRYFRRILFPLSFLIIFLIFHSMQIVVFLFGKDWEPSVNLVQIFAVGGLFQIVAIYGNWLLMIKGLSKYFLEVSRKIQLLRIICIVIGSFYGTMGAAIGYTTGHLLGTLIVYSLPQYRKSSSNAYISSQIIGVLIIFFFTNFLLNVTIFKNFEDVLIQFFIAATACLGLLYVCSRILNFSSFSKFNDHFGSFFNG